MTNETLIDGFKILAGRWQTFDTILKKPDRMDPWLDALREMPSDVWVQVCREFFLDRESSKIPTPRDFLSEHYQRRNRQKGSRKERAREWCDECGGRGVFQVDHSGSSVLYACSHCQNYLIDFAPDMPRAARWQICGHSEMALASPTESDMEAMREEGA